MRFSVTTGRCHGQIPTDPFSVTSGKYTCVGLAETPLSVSCSVTSIHAERKQHAKTTRKQSVRTDINQQAQLLTPAYLCLYTLTFGPLKRNGALRPRTRQPVGNQAAAAVARKEKACVNVPHFPMCRAKKPCTGSHNADLAVQAP